MLQSRQKRGSDFILDYLELHLAVLRQACQNVGVGQLAYDVVKKLIAYLAVGHELDEL